MRIPKSLAGVAAVTLAGSLALAACGEAEPDIITPGFEDCAENPNTCNFAPRESLAEGGHITWGVEQRFTNWNINHTNGNLFVASQTLSGVLPRIGWFNPDQSWSFNMELWEAEPEQTSTDPQTAVYRIREEAKWNDGTDISANDFIFRWKASSGDPELCDGCEPASTAGYAPIDRIEVSDEGKTFTVILKDGANDPEWQFRFGGVYPWHLAEAQGLDLDNPADVATAFNEFFAETQVDYSGGPYMIDSVVPEESVTLVPNPNWYGEWHPTLESITIRSVDDQQALVQGIQNREIDAAAPQPNPDMVQQARATDGLMSFVGFGYQWEHLDLNHEKEALQDVALRQAVFTAIDVNDINEATFATFAEGIEQKLNHIFKTDSEYHVDHISATGQGSGDVDLALSILDDAGYTLEGDQLLDPDGEPVPPLLFQHSAGNLLRQTTAELVQSHLADIGIEVQIEAAELGDILTDRDYDIVIFAWVGSPLFVGGPRQFWHSESPNNFGRYSNPEVDRLTDEALNQADLAESARLINEAIPHVVNDAYVLPISDKPEFIMVYNDYLNIRPNNNISGAVYNNQEWGQALTE
jgi:peptide/nickel transport system substrate-binding protein